MVSSCSDDSLPEGLYDYQVVRLLSGDTTKVWQLQDVEPELCDSIYYFSISNLIDSVEVSGIRWNCQTGGYTDTVFIDHAVPSSIGLLFSDSLIFNEEVYWHIEFLTSKNLDLVRFPEAQSLRLINP